MQEFQEIEDNDSFWKWYVGDYLIIYTNNFDIS